MDPYMRDMAHMNMMMGVQPPMIVIYPPMMGVQPPMMPMQPRMLMRSREPPPMMVRRCTHSTVEAVEFDDRFCFTCDGCQDIGYGSCYTCTNGCNYHLHEECLTASRVAYHPFSERPFTLQSQESPNTSNLCIACGISVKGLRYCQTQQRGSIYLHPCCMKMPHFIETDDDITLYLKKKLVNVACEYCERMTLPGRVEGYAYVSPDEELACHVKCMKEMMYEDWSIYGQMEEEELEGPWWLSHYGGPEFDNGFDQWVEPSRPLPSRQQQQQYHYPGQPQNSLALTTTRPSGHHNSGPPQNSLAMTTPRPTGRKRRAFWKITKASFSLLFNFATGDPISALTAFHEFL